MLESIKHVFDVPDVKFVLVANRDQIHAAINHRYGDTIDSHRYLDKFTGFRFALSNRFKNDRNELAPIAVSHLWRYLEESSQLKKSCLKDSGMFEFLTQMVNVHRLSLREVETFGKYLAIFHTLHPHGGFDSHIMFGYALLRSFGVFIFCFRPRIADDLAHGRVDGRELIELIGKDEAPDVAVLKPRGTIERLTGYLLIDANVDNKGLVISEELVAPWMEEIQWLFERDSWKTPRRGELMVPIVEAIDVLRMS
jgi:hypothetical protein